jgi:hypothetical protein
MMCGWISYLRHNHISLWQKYMDEQDEIRQSTDPKISKFVMLLKLDQEWAEKTKQLMTSNMQVEPCKP